MLIFRPSLLGVPGRTRRHPSQFTPLVRSPQKPRRRRSPSSSSPLPRRRGGAERSSRTFRVAGGSGRIWILRAVGWGRAGWAYGSAALDAGGHAAALGHLLGAWWGPGRVGRRRVPGTVGWVGGRGAGFCVRCTLRTGAAAAPSCRRWASCPFLMKDRR